MRLFKARSGLSAAAIATFLMLSVEIAVRVGGLVDFPTYGTDDEIGYLVRASQSGAFMNSHRWVFNDKSMAIGAPWNPALHPNILLIGNSIVMGGNPYDQKDKLGPLLQEQIGSGYSIWPIAVGGWSNVNETVYLDRHPEVANSASFFVWEYMNGGLSSLSRWHGEYVFPRKRPLWATGYLFRRYVLPRFLSVNRSELPPVGDVSTENAQRFENEINTLSIASAKPTPGILLLYPGKQQYGDAKLGREWLPERALLERIARSHHLRILDISQSREWNERLYREGPHPTVAGNRILAEILARSIKQTLACEGLPVRTAELYVAPSSSSCE